MKTLELTQGSPAWHAHRAQYKNASDAPAMLGVSPYKTRAQLIKERAEGLLPDMDAGRQRLFDDGHRFEALARPLAEEIIGDDLFPVVGVSGQYSASFDGITMDERTVFEHKSLNDELRAILLREDCTGAALPEHYRVQMEQQLMISGAERALFMASKWDGDALVDQAHCWYLPDPVLRARIIAGWKQFDADVAAHQPEAVTAAVVAAPVAGFGALSLRVEGRVLASNLDAFKADAEAFIGRLPKPADLQTDQDFVNADAAVKACAEAEARIKAATDAALAQMADVDAVMRTAASISESIRAARLALDKVVKAEKENRRADLLRAGAEAIRAHYASINATMQGYELSMPASITVDLGAAIKGLKSLASIRDKISGAVAQIKIEASQEADRRRLCIAVIDAHADHRHLLPDAARLVAEKSPDDLRNLIAARIAEHKAKEEARIEAERQRIRCEEEAKAKQEADRQAEQERARIREEERQRAEAELRERDQGNVPPAVPAPTVAERVTAGTAQSAVAGGARLKLGDINARIAPLSITTEGLASLGFQSVGTERAAKLYKSSDFPLICAALIALLQRAHSTKEAA